MKKVVTKIPNSSLFWNGLLLIGVLSLIWIDIQSFYVTIGLLCMVSFIFILNTAGEYDVKFENHLWLLYSPFIWGLIVLALFVSGVKWIYVKGIKNFNSWLDSEK